MTTSNPQRSVLVLGASQRVLDEAVAILRDLGYTAQGTSDFFSDITGRFDIANTDLVALGHLIPSDRKAELKEQIGAINPQVIFLDPPLAGIPGLIASQVQEAFTADRQDPTLAPAYAPGDRSIRLTLANPAAVKVTVYWRTALSRQTPKATRLSRRGNLQLQHRRRTITLTTDTVHTGSGGDTLDDWPCGIIAPDNPAASYIAPLRPWRLE